MKNSIRLNEISNKILETSIDGFFLLDTNGTILKTNTAYCNMVGYLEQELIGMHIGSLEVQMSTEEIEMKIESVIKSGNDRFETRQKCKDDSIIEIEVSTQLCEIGSDTFFPVFVRNITSQKHVISELQKNQERLSLGEKIANLGFFERIIETETHYWSNHAYQILGYEPQEFEGSIEKFISFVHPDDKEFLIDNSGKANTPQEVKKIKCRIIRKDGEVRKVQILGKTVFDSNGKAIRMVATIQDITEMEDNRELLATSEERFRDVATNAGEWIWEIDEQGRYVYSSPAVEDILGYTPEEVLEKYFYDLFHPYDKEEYKKAAFEVISSKKKFQGFINRNVHRDGHTVILETSGVPVIDKEGRLIGYRGVDRDLTESIEYQEQIKISENKYRTLFERTTDATFVIRNGKNVDCNQSALNMLGYTSVEEVLGTHPSQLSPEKQPDGRSSFEKANELMSIAVERGSHRFEWYHKRKNGEVFPVEVLLTSIPLEGKGFLHVVLRDLTESVKIQNELSEYKYRVLQTQRHSYINFLGGMVAHELNQPLTAINLLLGNSIHRMENSDVPCCQFVRQDLLRCLDETKRSVEIIKKFRGLSKEPSTAIDKPSSITEVADKIVSVMSAKAERSQIKITISSSVEIPEVKINEFVLEQIFLTIIQNAIDASDGKSKHSLQITVGKLNDDHVEVIFADDCGGIEPDNLEKIFQPFFTTKKDENSMGLGLEIVKKMLMHCDGDIRVESEFGKGATFYLVLPIDV